MVANWRDSSFFNKGRDRFEVEVSRVSVTIITLNEEANLSACLESVKWADEILVVDSESHDRTVAIARDFGCRVLINPWPGHKEQKNVAVDAASHEWILSIDADERLTPECQAEVRKIISDTNSLDGYTFPRKNFFLGKWMRHGGWYPDHVLRLFRKDKGRFGGINPHDKVMIGGNRITIIDLPIIHLTYNDFSQYITKQHTYATIAAEEIVKRKGKKIKIGQMTLVIKFLTKFLELYIWKRGFLDGLHGLVAALAASYFAFVKYAKVWEKQKTSI